MPKSKKWTLVWGISVTLLFLVLLTFRLELFQKEPEKIAARKAPNTKQSQDTWMNVYQNKKKIGVIHRTFTTLERGFQFSETARMQINTMGVTQALNISTEGQLHPDLTLSSFDFDLHSSLFHFNVRGIVAKNKLILFSGQAKVQQKHEIPLKEIPYLSGSIYDAAFHSNLEKGATAGFPIFDPSSFGTRLIKVTRQADEIIPVMGKRVLTQKYCADFMGAKNCAWLDKDGDILKEIGILGLTMEKVSRKMAQEGILSSGSLDFTEIAAVPVNVLIKEPVKLRELKIKIEGLGDALLYLHGGRQSYRRPLLTITKEQLSAVKLMPGAMSEYLKPSPLVQSEAPQIKEQSAAIINPQDTPWQKVEKIMHWVYRNIEKKPVLSVPNALEVLKNRTGDCNEHAVLTAALLRAAGIPAQIETGLVYLRGKFYYHAWNVAYLGSWITLDSVFDQIPTDVTHIRLIRGEASEQLDLIGIMGKIKLEILEQIQ